MQFMVDAPFEWTHSSLPPNRVDGNDNNPGYPKTSEVRKRAEYAFGEHGFKHRAQWGFWPSPSSGERTQWVPLSLVFVCHSELTEFYAELTEFAVKLSEAQWVLFSETVLSKQYPPVS